MKIFRALCLCLGLLLLSGTAFAEPVPDRISVLTMGPGSEAFARFGHNAILVEFGQGRGGVVYNFGTFAFNGLEGIEDFMAGHFRYWLSVSSFGRTLSFYGSRDRTLMAQELELTAPERAKLFAALMQNALPENRFYDYDYYRDNCSTRVRDAVDKLLGGELHRNIQGPGRLTFRQHTERLTGEDLWLSLGLDLALGPLTDRPTSRWDELFIPGELHDELAKVKRTVDGQQVPLVKNEHVYLTAPNREPVPNDPPARVPAFFGVGVAAGVLLGICGRAGRTSRAARALFGLASSLIGLVLGLLGTIFVVFWAFTKHWSAYRNENILTCPPWALALLVLGIGVALGGAQAKKRFHFIVLLSALSAGVAFLLALIPGFGQDNTRIAALLAPIWFGIYWGSAALNDVPVLPPEWLKRVHV